MINEKVFRIENEKKIVKAVLLYLLYIVIMQKENRFGRAEVWAGIGLPESANYKAITEAHRAGGDG